MIEFIDHNDYTLIYAETSNGTLTSCIHNDDIVLFESMTIEQIEQILAKMKELQGNKCQ